MDLIVENKNCGKNRNKLRDQNKRPLAAEARV